MQINKIVKSTHNLSKNRVSLLQLCHAQRRFYSSNVLAASPFIHDAHSMYARLKNPGLPRLSVSPLDETVDKYLKSLQPLLSTSELSNSAKILSQFKKSKDAEELQELLEKKAANSENWLTPWWTECAYLGYRDPIVIESNPGVKFPIQKFASHADWLNYAANLVHHCVQYKLDIDAHRLKPEKQGDGTPMCMAQYSALFSSCRIPGPRHDTFYHENAASSSPSPPNHITVVHNNQFFEVRVLDENAASGGPRALPIGQIAASLAHAVRLSPNRGQPIGVFTADHRDKWGGRNWRPLLDAHPHNSRSLRSIQRALFVLCLDAPVFSAAERSLRERCEANLARLEKVGGSALCDDESVALINAVCGGGHKINSANRWFDKTLQLIVSEDGACGINYEHTSAEAVPIAALTNYVMARLNRDDDGQSKSTGSSQSEAERSVIPLAFSLTAELRVALDSSKADLARAVDDYQCNYFELAGEGDGKGGGIGKALAKRHSLSPDAFFQVGLQLASQALHATPMATYESGSLRKFHLGRTDTIRSCTSEAARFAEAMLDNHNRAPDAEQQEGGQLSAHQLADLFKEAVRAHSDYTTQVMQGRGVDRHLLGLRLIAAQHGRTLPDVFLDEAYALSSQFRLSTSQVTFDPKCDTGNTVMAFGTLTGDGYGICYNLGHPDKILAGISCRNKCSETDSFQMKLYLSEAFRSIKHILDESSSDTTGQRQQQVPGFVRENVRYKK